jgi:DNA-binding NtrC family response regulator
MEATNVSIIEQQPTLCCQAAGARSEGHVIARSAAMRESLDLVRKIAGADVPVLILGEIGVGKQTIAREIHRQSPRGAEPFVHIVCGSLRESELDEKLFGQSWDGSRRGTSPSASPWEESQGGTLFLDRVEQLPLWAQIKLLDALQCSRGRNRENVARVPAQARLIASSTCNLETSVVENRFYSGLYYYLNAVRIDIPPLRHRQEDIPALAEHFLAAAVSLFGPPQNRLPWHFSAEARQALLRCEWPGNVLQLAAVVAHAAVLAEGPVIGQACVAGLLGSVPQRADSAMISVPLASSLKQMELAIIHEIIRRCRGNKAAAARTLGLHRRTLYRLLEE